MTDDSVKARIGQALCEIEAQHGCRVLFAVESGSRAWGFASADSDYDVRGVYVKPLDWYLQLKTDLPDTIDKNLPGDLDVSLWDLRKALLQMAKSNASFLEWLGSPIVYRDCGMLGQLNEMKSGCFNAVHVAFHYASMFRHAMSSGTEDGFLPIKKLCYALRAGLCLRYVMDFEKMPPTKFSDVLAVVHLSPEERTAIQEVLAQKASARESDAVVPDCRLGDILTDRYESLNAHSWRAQGRDATSYDRLEAFFRDVVCAPDWGRSEDDSV